LIQKHIPSQILAEILLKGLFVIVRSIQT